MTSEIRIERSGAVGWLIFDHAARRNAMTYDMWSAVPGACAELEADRSIRVVVLRGEGELAFVAGADISQFSEVRSGDSSASYDDVTDAAYSAIARLRKPTIAMVHGFCIGGGLAISLCADIRYAADDATFGLPPARLGIGYSADGLASLVDLVGPAVAREMVYTADLIDVETAQAWGLINRTLPKSELEAFTVAQATTMSHRAPLSQYAAKLAVGNHLAEPEAKDHQAVADAIAACFRSDDYAEGVSAFLEKRSPNFTGQ